jgi:hypothetical protein
VREEADLALAVGALLAQRSVIPAERVHGRPLKLGIALGLNRRAIAPWLSSATHCCR